MSNKKQSNLKVSLIIFDLECDPNALTKVLNIEPTSIDRVGDLTHSGRPKLNSSNCWEIESSLTDNSELNEHIQALYLKLGDLSKISVVSKTWGVKVDCVVEFYGDDNSLSLSLSEDSIQTMSKWRSLIDLDYYLFP